jgi:hypothetical protein
LFNSDVSGAVKDCSYLPVNGANASHQSISKVIAYSALSYLTSITVLPFQAILADAYDLVSNQS